MYRLFHTRRSKAGFALIVAVSMMAFILLMIISLTTVVSLEISAASTAKADRKAKENARLGMLVALGELQLAAGPDRRVTAQGSIFTATSDNSSTGLNVLSPNWTGIWTTSGAWEKEGELNRGQIDTHVSNWKTSNSQQKVDQARWLVSGNTGLNPDDPDYITPLTDLSTFDANDLITIVEDESAAPGNDVVVPREAIGGNNTGHYAYWIADENAKARVDLVDDNVISPETGSNEEKHFALTKAFQVSQRSGLESLEGLEGFPANTSAAEQVIDLSSAITASYENQTLDGDDAKLIEDKYFSALTPWSKGLLVDVKNGGLKRDLTQAFEYRNIFDENFVLINDDDMDIDPVAFQEPLYFIDDPVMVANGIDNFDSSGPNWHILRSYYRQYIPGTKSAKFSWNKANAEEISGELAEIREKVDLEDYTELVKEKPDYATPYLEYANASSQSNDQKLSKYLGWGHNRIRYGFGPASSTGKPYQTIPDSAEEYLGEELRNQADNYQLHSFLTPVISRLQISFGLIEDSNGLGLIIKPVLGLYNPYNTEITLNRLKFSWGINPTIVISVAGGAPVEFSLREVMPIDGAGALSFFVKDKNTEKLGTVSLRPGETRFYGINPSVIPEYEPERIASGGNGLYLFWRDSNLNVIGSKSGDGNAKRNFLTNFDGSPGGLIIPFSLSIEAYTPENEKTVRPLHEGPTEIKWFRGTAKGKEDPRDEPSWGLIASERARLGALVDPTITVIQSIDFSIRMSSARSAGLNVGFSSSSTVQSIAKVFADFPNSGSGLSRTVNFTSIADAAREDEIITIGYWLRMPEVESDPWRSLIDSNIRAINANSEWDGFNETNGYRVMSSFTTADSQNKRGELNTFDASIQLHDFDRGSGYWGESNPGTEIIALFDRPRTPLQSLGSLQHANLGRYNLDPTYMIGNSYANVRIPLDQTASEAHTTYTYSNYTGDPIPDNNPYPFKLFDTSYLVNEKLWDRYFFSGIAEDAIEDDLNEFKNGSSPFGNQRYSYSERAEELTFTDLEAREDGNTLFKSMAANIEVDGAFNVNSTSVEAWKAFLGGLSQDTLPIYDYDSGYTTESGGVVSSRFTWPYHGKVNLDEGTGTDNFWKGVREISDDELDNLAKAIVDQVKTRGPFLSFADFVNRSLKNDDTGKFGTLQAALDDPRLGVNTNAKLSGVSSAGPSTIPGTGFNDVFPDTNMQAAGFPGYVLQGDILQRLAPVMTLRGDTFIIRSYGDYTDPLTGKVTGEAWCEAVVQRTVLPVDTDYISNPNELINPTNEQGRQFEVLSFRWLNENEI